MLFGRTTFQRSMRVDTPGAVAPLRRERFEEKIPDCAKRRGAHVFHADAPSVSVVECSGVAGDGPSPADFGPLPGERRSCGPRRAGPVSFPNPTAKLRSGCYNGAVPGPEIRIRQGDRVRIFVENGLEEETTVHWHGVRLPNAMDGVPHLTQLPFDRAEPLPTSSMPSTPERSGTTRTSEVRNRWGAAYTARSSSKKSIRSASTVT